MMKEMKCAGQVKYEMCCDAKGQMKRGQTAKLRTK